MKFTKLLRMMTTGLLLFMTGCETKPNESGSYTGWDHNVSPLMTVVFQGHRVTIGQSTASIESLLGHPDRISNRPWLRVYKIGSWVFPGYQTLEWVYFGETYSLVLWFDTDEVQIIWLAETSWLEE